MTNTGSTDRELSTPPRRWLPQVLQLLKFGAVGAVGVVVNVAVFNALWLTVFNPSRMPHGPLLATAVATLVAIVVNWIGNRYWAFARERQRNTAREGFEFLIASLIGMCVPLLCIGASRYVLGLHSLLADNIASNVVGLGLGTVVRYVLYKFWVYAPNRSRNSTAGTDAATRPETPISESPNDRLHSAAKADAAALSLAPDLDDSVG